MGVLTIKQIQNLLRTMTLNITGLPDENIRFAYSQQGQPAWDIEGIKGNVISIFITPVNNPYDKQRDIKFSELDDETAEQEVFYTRVLSCLWTLYGPDSYDTADTLRSGLLLEQNRYQLAVNQIFPLTEVPAPIRLPYNYNAQNWQRTDLQAYYNVGTLRVSEVPYLQSADIGIYTEDGLQRFIEVRES